MTPRDRAIGIISGHRMTALENAGLAVVDAAELERLRSYAQRWFDFAQRCGQICSDARERVEEEP